MKVKKVVPCLFIFLRKVKTTKFKWRQKPNNVNMYNLKMGTWDFGKPSQISWFFQHQNIANLKRHQEEEDWCIPEEEEANSNSVRDSDFAIAQLCHKWSIHLIKKHLITLHFLHCLINQESPIYLFLSHIFSITKQTQNAIFQNQPNIPTFSLSFLVFSETKQGV